MPRIDGPFKSLDDLHEQQLQIYKAMFHSELGAAAALHYCMTHRLKVPYWVNMHANELLSGALNSKRPKRRGRSAEPVARYRQDMIDFDRWSMVREVREKQVEFAKTVEELRARSNAPPAQLIEHEKMLEWLGHTLDRAYECASMILAHEDSFGSPGTIKASYLEVERNSHDPKQPMRYHILDTAFLRKIGCDINPLGRQVNKHVPLYDLTL